MKVYDKLTKEFNELDKKRNDYNMQIMFLDDEAQEKLQNEDYENFKKEIDKTEWYKKI